MKSENGAMRKNFAGRRKGRRGLGSGDEGSS